MATAIISGLTLAATQAATAGAAAGSAIGTSIGGGLASAGIGAGATATGVPAAVAAGSSIGSTVGGALGSAVGLVPTGLAAAAANPVATAGLASAAGTVGQFAKGTPKAPDAQAGRKAAAAKSAAIETDIARRRGGSTLLSRTGPRAAARTSRPTLLGAR